MPCFLAGHVFTWGLITPYDRAPYIGWSEVLFNLFKSRVFNLNIPHPGDDSRFQGNPTAEVLSYVCCRREIEKEPEWQVCKWRRDSVTPLHSWYTVATIHTVANDIHLFEVQGSKHG